MTAPVTPTSASATKRHKGVQFSVPIIYGSKAQAMQPEEIARRQLDPSHTHAWQVFFRPALDNTDLSWLIERVQIQLHESFTDAKRSTLKCPVLVLWLRLDFSGPPYEGEFEIVMKVFFVDQCEKAATLYHHLRLFPISAKPDTPIDPNAPVIFERYDELVFVDPPEQLYQRYQLWQAQQKQLALIQVTNNGESVTEQQELAQFQTALNKIKAQTATHRSKMLESAVEVESLRSQVERMEKRQLGLDLSADEADESTDTSAVVDSTTAGETSTEDDGEYVTGTSRRKKKTKRKK